MKVHIGCSGYNYKDWRGKFYPEKMPQKKWLEYYASIFDTVEINNTFYKFPREKALKQWEEIVPSNFRITLKGHRYITHRKKLKDVERSVSDFEALTKFLKRKMGCLLWQLPGNLHRNDEKLVDFCRTLDGRRKNVIEFRHESWFHEEVYEILREHKVIFCSISSPEFPEEMITTHKTGYLRFHGKGKKWYDYLYSQKELEGWHRKIQNTNLEEIFIYFNNDIHANAPKNAEQLKKLFG